MVPASTVTIVSADPLGSRPSLVLLAAVLGLVVVSAGVLRRWFDRTTAGGHPRP